MQGYIWPKEQQYPFTAVSSICSMWTSMCWWDPQFFRRAKTSEQSRCKVTFDPIAGETNKQIAYCGAPWMPVQRRVALCWSPRRIWTEATDGMLSRFTIWSIRSDMSLLAWTASRSKLASSQNIIKAPTGWGYCQEGCNIWICAWPFEVLCLTSLAAIPPRLWE